MQSIHEIQRLHASHARIDYNQVIVPENPIYDFVYKLLNPHMDMKKIRMTWRAQL